MYESLSLAELDGLVSAGRISMDEYWRARVEIERRLETQSHEQTFDLAPRDRGAEDTAWVPPPPRLLHPQGPGAAPPPPVPPAPPPGWGPHQWIQLGFDAPARDAAEARGDLRRRRRWWHRAR